MNLKTGQLSCITLQILLAVTYLPMSFSKLRHRQIDEDVDNELLSESFEMEGNGEKPTTHDGCHEEGYFFPDYETCGIYYRCYSNGQGGWNRETFKCPEGHSFFEKLQGCDNVPCPAREPWPEVPLHLPCGEGSHRKKFQVPGDCRKYYICIWTGSYFTYRYGMCVKSFFNQKTQSCKFSYFCPQEDVKVPQGWLCGKSPEQRFPHPEDCSKYYHCYPCDSEYSNKKEECVKVMECPDGQIFNPEGSEDDYCIPGECPTTEMRLPGDFECCSEGQVHVHKTNCTLYYKCHKCNDEQNGDWCYDSFESCPPDHLFDDNSKKCIEGKICPQDLPLLPAEPGWKCEHEGDVRVHPKDCSQFYTCKSCGKRGGSCYELSKCPLGQLFDNVQKMCVHSLVCPKELMELPTGDGWECEVEDEKNVVPNNCEDYYFCLPCDRPGGWCYTRQKCSEGHTFNNLLKICVEGKCPQDPTPIPDNFICEDDGDVHVHPDDCSRYYRCVKTEHFYTWEDEECGDGETFDDFTKECVEGMCPQFMRSLEDVPDLKCDEEGEEHVFPENCASYYICHKCNRPGGWCFEEEQCPAGQSYDDTQKKCVEGRCAQLPPKIPEEWSCSADGESHVLNDDCSSYYTCMTCEDGGWCYNEIQTCAEGETFDDTKKLCVQGRCKQYPELLPPTWKCNKEGDRYVNPLNCSKYYSCLMCPDMTGWCYNSHSCEAGSSFDNKEKVCVAGRCPQALPILPKGWRCSADEELHANPTNCTKYYACVKKCPDADWCHIPRNCPKGSFFDEYAKKCVPGEICPQDRPEIPDGFVCSSNSEKQGFPNDCQSFYTCHRCVKKKGWCYEKTTCPWGHTFDKVTKQCIQARCPEWPEKIPEGIHCGEVNEMHPVPKSCYDYYKCIPCPEGGWCYEKGRCPSGQTFDKHRMKCVNGQCQQPKPLPDNFRCHWNADGNFTVHPDDCKKYFECVDCPNSNKWCYELYECPNGQYFDDYEIRCVTSNVCPNSSEEDY